MACLKTFLLLLGRHLVQAQLEAALAIPASAASPRGTDRRQLHARAIRPYPAASLEADAQGREEALPLESLLTLGRPTTGAVPRTRWPMAATLVGLAVAVVTIAWWAISTVGQWAFGR